MQRSHLFVVITVMLLELDGHMTVQSAFARYCSRKRLAYEGMFIAEDNGVVFPDAKCNNRPVWSRIEPWLGASLDNAYPVDELILRYLQAFGPASTMDMQTWSKLVGLKEVVERLGDRIRTYTDENGRTLYDAADGLLADPDEPAPVRYLGWYDNVFLSHKDRSRIVPEAQSPALRTLATNSAPVLLDGFAAGLYKIHVEGETATLRLAPSVRLSKRDEKALESEALRLVGFLEQGRTPAFELVE